MRDVLQVLRGTLSCLLQLTLEFGVFSLQLLICPSWPCDSTGVSTTGS